MWNDRNEPRQISRDARRLAPVISIGNQERVRSKNLAYEPAATRQCSLFLTGPDAENELTLDENAARRIDAVKRKSEKKRSRAFPAGRQTFPGTTSVRIADQARSLERTL